MEKELRKILWLIEKANKAKIEKKNLKEKEIQKLLKNKNIQLFKDVKEEEIRIAYAKALIAFYEKTNFSKSLRNEIIARLANERNISKAIKNFGAKEGKVTILFLKNKKE
jgi:tRNA threonylcarbamoyladenosine modification (KEOPS) complex Cgi121 subunit